VTEAYILSGRIEGRPSDRDLRHRKRGNPYLLSDRAPSIFHPRSSRDTISQHKCQEGPHQDVIFQVALNIRARPNQNASLHPSRGVCKERRPQIGGYEPTGAQSADLANLRGQVKTSLLKTMARQSQRLNRSLTFQLYEADTHRTPSFLTIWCGGFLNVEVAGQSGQYRRGRR